MNIRTFFKNEDELAKRFGEPFVRMYHCLLERYARRGKPMHSQALRAAALAFVFYGAAQEGNCELMANFDSMLHGVHAERLMLGDQLLVPMDDLGATLVWDIVALMLETNASLPQVAFDTVGSHVWLAYENDQSASAQQAESQGTTEGGKRPVMSVEAKRVNTEVPALSKETMEWMLRDAASVGDVQRVNHLTLTFTRNLLQRYFGDEFQLFETYSQMARERSMAAVLAREKAKAIQDQTEALEAQTAALEALAARPAATQIGQLNMGNGEQQLPPGVNLPLLPKQ